MNKNGIDSSKIARNSLFLAIRMTIVMMISIFTTRYLLANLGVEDYGVYNVTLGIVSMCSFLSPAISNANQRFHNYELGKNGIDGAKRVFNTGILIQVAVITIVIFIAETIGLWYVQNRLIVPEGREVSVFWVYQISIIAFSISMLQIPITSSILAHEKMDFYAIVNVLDAVLKLSIAIGIAYSTYDHLIIYGILLLGINIMNLLLYSLYAFKKFEEIRISRRVDKSMIKKMLFFSGWNLFETIARMGKDLGGNLLLNYFFGPVLNAARGVTNQVSYAFSSMVDSTVMASRPQMVASYAQGNVKTSLSMFITLSKGVLLIISAFAVPVFLEVDYILKLWLGNNIPQYTNDLIRISLFILLVDKLASPVTALIHATGKVKKYHTISGLLNLSVIPFGYLLLSIDYGPLSVYIVTLCVAMIAQLIYLIVIKEMLPFSLSSYFKEVVSPFMIVLFTAVPLPLVFYVIISGGIFRMALVVISSLICIAISAYTLGLNKREKEIVCKLLSFNI